MITYAGMAPLSRTRSRDADRDRHLERRRPRGRAGWSISGNVKVASTNGAIESDSFAPPSHSIVIDLGSGSDNQVTVDDLSSLNLTVPITMGTPTAMTP